MGAEDAVRIPVPTAREALEIRGGCQGHAGKCAYPRRAARNGVLAAVAHGSGWGRAASCRP
jgi:hypothetical protein